MNRIPQSVPQTWTRGAVIGGAVYFVLFAIAVSLCETVGHLVAAPAADGAPTFNIRELILIIAAWVAAFTAAGANRVPDRPAPRLLMGLIGFVLLILAEAYVSLVIENQPPGKLAASFGSASGILRLLSYAAFGLVPLLQIWVRWQSPEDADHPVKTFHH